jgi:hypothetical protein
VAAGKSGCQWMQSPGAYATLHWSKNGQLRIATRIDVENITIILKFQRMAAGREPLGRPARLCLAHRASEKSHFGRMILGRFHTERYRRYTHGINLIRGTPMINHALTAHDGRET